MQKFTRPITREVEVAGERLALTVTEAGITVRPVGSRRPPREITWGALLCHLTGQELGISEEPGAEHLSRAVGALKTGSPSPRAARPDPAPTEQSVPTPAAPGAAEQHPRTADYTALLSRLERWLAEHRPKYLHALHPGASAAELDALQTEMGRPLPAGLRTLLAWHNGQKEDFTGRFEEIWMLLGTQGIAAAKKELDGDERRDWIPFGEDDAGDFLCVDAGDAAEPVREFWLGKPAEPPVAPSLATWLEQFLAALEKGEYHEDPERGAFLRTGQA